MRRLYFIQLLFLLFCIGCEWRWNTADDAVDDRTVTVQRYDRLECLYLTTGDFSALQQMNTGYPRQTRTLIEDVVKIGRADDPEINHKFLAYFQDSTLQSLISEAQQQYAQMDDIEEELSDAFAWLCKEIPGFVVPTVYAQVSSLDQSIVVAGDQLGISLDKYLGSDYSLYQRPDYGYTDHQRQMMRRQCIVPDCLSFYLLSLYPMPAGSDSSQVARDMHMGKIQWVVNRSMNREFFQNLYVRTVDRYMKKNRNLGIVQMLEQVDSRTIRN